MFIQVGNKLVKLNNKAVIKLLNPCCVIIEKMIIEYVCTVHLQGIVGVKRVICNMSEKRLPDVSKILDIQSCVAKKFSGLLSLATTRGRIGTKRP